MSRQEFFKAGYISRTHGLKGGVVLNFAQEPINEPSELYMQRGDGTFQALPVESWSARPDLAFVTFEGISNIDQAQALRGQTLYLPTEKGEAEHFEFHGEALIGFQIQDPSGQTLGSVSRYSAEGGRQLLLVSLPDKREIIIPADGPFLTRIDRRKKIIEADLPDGFLEI